MGDKPYLQFHSVSKAFPGVQALDDVTFGVDEGSVHALIGENGAGKSTLLKVLSGAHQPNGGSLSFGGVEYAFSNAREALEAGVAVIYQELNLIPDMSVEENLLLGHMPTRLGVIDRRSMRARAREALERLGELIDPAAKVRSLSIGQQQMVEIAKALMRDAKVIAFDEPTSSLSHKEVELLFNAIRGLRRDGRAVIYVSHRLAEVFELCDAATVFRDGKLVVTQDSLDGIDHAFLVRNMVGRSISDIFHYTPREQGETVLEVNDLFGYGLTEPASFSVRKGEILGFFGLIGAGRTELLRLLFGAERPESGTTLVDGAPVRIRNTRDAIRHGLALMPEDRKVDGIIGVRSVAENINLAVRPTLAHYGGLLIDERRERENADAFVEKLTIKTPSTRQLMRNLSGGNQQKSILARWLSRHARVFLMDEPTRGIDVGTKSEIYSIMYDLAESGLGVIMVSSELPEILGVCDRIIVMREGVIAGEVTRDEASEELLLKLALPDSAAAGAAQTA
jgi:L-arabinose transport system ATP-binding protein